MRPQCGPVLLQAALTDFGHEPAEADLGGNNVSAERGGGLQDVGGFLRTEGDGDVGADGKAGNGAAVAIDAGGDVDGDDLGAGSVDLLGGESGFPRQGPRQACAEKAVEHDVVRAEAHVLKRLPRAGERIERQGAFGRAVSRWREIVEPHIAAEIAQALGRYEGVAAIIAGTSEHDDAAFGKFCVQDVGAGLLAQARAFCAWRGGPAPGQRA